MKKGESEFVDALPSIFGDYDAVPNDLAGAIVVRLGTIPGQRVATGGLVEGGGLVIDYRPRGQKRTKRAVFGFNECGMWVQSVKFVAG